MGVVLCKGLCPEHFSLSILGWKSCGIHFLEMVLGRGHAHFLIQRVPMISPKNMIGSIKSIMAKEMVRPHPEVKQLIYSTAVL